MKNEKKNTGTGSEKNTPAKKGAKKKKESSALLAASVARSATDQVKAHSGDGALARTGTNVSYEGATAPGGGGSVGTGNASGQSATGTSIETNSEYEQSGGNKKTKSK